jgi:hypothetical protein
MRQTIKFGKLRAMGDRSGIYIRGAFRKMHPEVYELTITRGTFVKRGA